MTAPRLFIEPAWLEARRRRVHLPRDQARYLRTVLRLSTGAPVTLFDGSGREYAAVLADVAPRGATAAIVREEEARGHGNGVVLAVALTRGSRLDLVVQKATELGASAMRPLLTRRAVPRADDGAASRVARWRRIAVEAAEQCGRGDLPAVHPAEPLRAFLSRPCPGALKLCFHEGAARGEAAVRPLREVLASAGARRPLVTLLGPEGGLEPEEAEAARAAGYEWVGLGPRVLRAETAALAALAILAYELER